MKSVYPIAVFYTLLVSFLLTGSALAQSSAEWQQKVGYDMEIDLNVEDHTMQGKQRVVYYNNSPDTLNRIFYHLYFNAFQPNSMMDRRSRWLPDPDSRVRDRILHLNEKEIGYHRINSLKQEGQDVDYHIESTLLEGRLPEPLAPGDSTVLTMDFNSQVPLQVRRSGRDNKEGIDFSMTQWYPKIAEYDHHGWHTHPYVQREFIGVFGTFDVKITLDSAYTIGGTGVLQNPQEVGHGYQDPEKPLNRPDDGELTWHFRAGNVHTFAWAADENYTHDTYQVPEGGPKVHMLYVDEPQTGDWKLLGQRTIDAIKYISDQVGEYPYPQFSVIQGGDGGMEYPMSTLITGRRSQGSLTGVMIHELAHMWFYGALGFNESLYPWLDEGFTTYFTNETFQQFYPNDRPAQLPYILGYLSLQEDGFEEPSSTHADWYHTNRAYTVAAYYKPAAFIEQLGYVIGDEARDEGIRHLYENHKFTHPSPTEVKRSFEETSGLQLDWYFRYWTHSTDAVDLAIDKVKTRQDSLQITLKRNSELAMPVDLQVEYEDGTKELHYIPLGLMRGEKPSEPEYGERTVHEDWNWTHPEYTFTTAANGEVEDVVLDPSLRLADKNRLNNRDAFPLELNFNQRVSPDWTSYQTSWRPGLWYGEDIGLKLGLRAESAYLFDQHELSVGLWYTSGYDGESYFGSGKPDIDYDLHYATNLHNPVFGRGSRIALDLTRYYGFAEERISYRKPLGRFGARAETRQSVELQLFHNAKMADRRIDDPFGYWEDGDTYGARLAYQYGGSPANSVRLTAMSAIHNDWQGVGKATLTANRTWNLNGNLSLRAGFKGELGTELLPGQFRSSTFQPSLYGQWGNRAYSGLVNIDAQLRSDLHFNAIQPYGLSGYALAERSPLYYPGEHMLLGTLQGEWRPADRLPLYLQLFSGIGQDWSSEDLLRGPLNNISSGYGFDDNRLDASLGIGARFDASELRALNRRIPQSYLLQDLDLSVQMPFFLNDFPGEDDWKPRFLFGVVHQF